MKYLDYIKHIGGDKFLVGGKIKLTAKQLPDFLNALGFQVEDKRF